MSNSADDLKHDRECLRLAPDFMQLSRETLNPNLQAHCIRMATHWADRADRGLSTDLACSDKSDK